MDLSIEGIRTQGAARSTGQHERIATFRFSHFLLFVCFALASAALPADAAGLEYRFKAPDGVEYKSQNGITEKLESQPFMSGPDFSNAIAIKSNTKLSFEVDIIHNRKGKQKYRATAEATDQR